MVARKIVTYSSAGTITQVFGWTAGPKRHHRRLGHINLSPQAVSDGLPLVKAINGLFKGVEFIDQLPKTLQVAE
jgi:hypothetical protein